MTLEIFGNFWKISKNFRPPSNGYLFPKCGNIWKFLKFGKFGEILGNFGKFLGKFGKIWEIFGEIWENLGNLKKFGKFGKKKKCGALRTIEQ